MRFVGRFLAFSIFSCSVGPGYAVSYSYAGAVTNSVSNPLAGVSVRLAASGARVRTDASGYWMLVQTDVGVVARSTDAAAHAKSPLVIDGGRIMIAIDGRLADGRRMHPSTKSASDSVASSLSRGLVDGADDTLVFTKPGYVQLRVPVRYADARIDTQLASAGTPGMVLVPGGTFVMGSSGVTGATPHDVTLDSFLVDTTEVTRASYKKLVGTDPSRSSPLCERCPVESVNWYDAVRYCNARSLAEGRTAAYDISSSDSTRWTWIEGATGYRLPTEAEWEYAARGGSTDDWFWGPYIDSATLSQYAWYKVNSGDSTHPVGMLKANAYGLKDVSGNVWEWVWDWYQSTYPSEAATNPTGPVADANRVYKVIRGGGLDAPNTETPQTVRSNVLPYNAWYSVGFRCVSGLR
jgi:formylglycine-generating enzyme required for sulfatase activity